MEIVHGFSEYFQRLNEQIDISFDSQKKVYYDKSGSHKGGAMGPHNNRQSNKKA